MNLSLGQSKSFENQYALQNTNYHSQNTTQSLDQQNIPYLTNEESRMGQTYKSEQITTVDDKNDIKKLAGILTSFSSQGQVTNIVYKMFFKDGKVVQTPPTILKLLKEMLNLDNTCYPESVPIGMQIGDILMCYGTLQQFSATIPSQYLQKYGHQIEHLIIKYFPKNTRGITLNFQQVEKLCSDCQINEAFIDRKVLNIIFTRATSLQAKYICDYCMHTSVKSEAYIIDKYIQEYSFTDFNINKLNVSLYENKDYKIKEGNPKVLNYLGFLIFIQMLSYQLVQNTLPGYFYECSNFCYNDQYVLSYSQHAKEVKEALTQSEALATQQTSGYQQHLSSSINNQMQHDSFKNTVQYIQVGSKVMELTVNTHAIGWKLTYIFACMLDHVILPRAKKFGYNQQSNLMNMALFLDIQKKQTVYWKEDQEVIHDQPITPSFLQLSPNYKASLDIYYQYEQALQKYINKIKGTNPNLTKDMVYRVLKDAAVIQQISAQFVYEYMLRNHTEFDKGFTPELTVRQTINCIFVGANLAFARHPYNIQLKSPEQRFRHAICNILRGMK